MKNLALILALSMTAAPALAGGLLTAERPMPRQEASTMGYQERLALQRNLGIDSHVVPYRHCGEDTRNNHWNRADNDVCGVVVPDGWGDWANDGRDETSRGGKDGGTAGAGGTGDGGGDGGTAGSGGKGGDSSGGGGKGSDGGGKGSGKGGKGSDGKGGGKGSDGGKGSGGKGGGQGKGGGGKGGKGGGCSCR